MKQEIKQILERLEAPEDIIAETPGRFEKVLKEFVGKKGEAPPIIKQFDVAETSEMILVSGLEAATLCPHHLLLYTVEASFAYIPDKNKVVGISKPGRLLEWVCARLILQEEMGPLFLKVFNEAVKPKGSAIILKGLHSCTRTRGSKQRISTVITVAFSGVIKDDLIQKQTFWEVLRIGGTVG